MQQLPEKENICGIIVSYHPEASLLTNVEALAPQVARIVVVDNGSSLGSQNILSQLEAFQGVVVIRNTSNLGVAAALNIGVRWALRQDYAWVATFDQDSLVSSSMIEQLGQCAQSYPHLDQLGIIAPQYWDTGRNVAIGFGQHDSATLFTPILTTMTSGNLVNLSIFGKIGFYDEELFIDLVDAEFCLRCAQSQIHMIESSQAVLAHHLGNPSQHWFLGKKVWVGNYGATRRYYMVRNRMRVYHRYWRSFPSWVLTDMFNFSKHCTGAVLLEADRGAKIASIIQGLCDGLRGRYGKRPDERRSP